MNDKEMKKQAKEFEEWENSIEGIRYDLNVIGDATIQSEEDKILICKTLQRLPKEIREQVLDEVVFITMSGLYGTVARLSLLVKKEREFKNKIYISSPLILLNFDKMRTEKEKESVMMDTIAHEIGHYISGHDKVECKTNSPDGEKEADDLAVKWGFNRAYKDYKMFK